MSIHPKEARTATKPAALPGLTGLRGLAALWVLVFHAQIGLNFPIAEQGYLGVDIFFVLSGFILCHAHPDVTWDVATYVRFLRTRVARIFPMHWFALGCIVAVVCIDPAIPRSMPQKFLWSDLPTTALLIQNWGFGPLYPWNIPAWTLSTEWLVSIAFPVFYLASRRIGRPVLSCLLCIACLLAFAIFLVLTHNPDPGVSYRAGIVRTVCEFAAGCLLHRVYAARTRTVILVLPAAAATLVTWAVIPSVTILLLFWIPVLILAAARSRTLAVRMLSTAPMVFLGEISFSVYLLHSTFLLASNQLQDVLHIHGAYALAWFCGYLLLVLASSTATHALVEVPMRRRLRPRPSGETRLRASLRADDAPPVDRQDQAVTTPNSSF